MSDIASDKFLDDEFDIDLDNPKSAETNDWEFLGDDESEDEEDLYEEDEDEIEEEDNQEEFDGEADDSGTEIDLMEEGLLEEEHKEDEYTIAHPSSEFLNEDGEISVMEEGEDEEDTNKFKVIRVPIKNIAIAAMRIRQNRNVDDLCKSIKSTGLLNPIVIVPTKTEGFYVLIHGYRRLLACAKLKRKYIDAIVNNRIKTTEIPILEALYNQARDYTIKEQIDYINYLEKEKGVVSSTFIEYILQMNSGDYAKLKDILEDDDPDIVSKLYEGLFTIQQAFKALENRRKKESKEEKETRLAAKVYDKEEESGIDAVKDSGITGDDAGEESDGVELTDDEIKDIASGLDDLDSEEESLDEAVKEGKEIPGFEAHKQDYKHRERLDPAVRKAVIARDNSTCQICKVISGQEYTEVLDVHHKQEVYLGGDDSMENLITACTVCHKLVHLYGRGDLHIRPMEELNEADQAKFKRIVKLGNAIRKGIALKGIKRDELKKMDNADTIGRTKPGTPQVAG